jgi:4-nitrophenyl phosphatase
MTIRLDTKTPERYQELLDKYDTWMFDCDGVLWLGDRLIRRGGGAPISTQPE